MKQALYPSHPHGAKLTQIFGYGWKWLEAPLEQHHLSTAWKTNSKYRIKPRVLWSAWQDPKRVVGVRFGSSTGYGLIDIDATSAYLERIDDILAALETIGIVRVIILRSSWSGGIHIYCPLPQHYPTFSVACALQQCLEAQGLQIAPGQLECFPNVKSWGNFWKKQFTEYNGHRLPLQPMTGACVLDEDLNPISGAYDLALFLAQWDNAVLQNDAETISEAIAVARANRRHRYRTKASGPVEDWKNDLEAMIAEGWTDHGQTNMLLKEIATYGRVFKGLGVTELVEYIETTATSCPGFEQWCQHQHQIHRKAISWAASASNYYWPLGSTPLRDRTRTGVNKARAEDARDRIAAAVRELGELVGLTVSWLVKHLAKAAQTSSQTLYKNADLWHPERSQPAMPVIDAIPSVSATQEQVRAAILASLESVGNGPITRNGGENEACIAENPLSKFKPPQGKGGEREGREGISTGWLPSLDWKPGAVGDCHA
ncbi:hypothetical protein [Nodosilinea sp. FACHB-13]|uniref:hypothetical protein n=1 Tax=Cyanophyceae TaxID=3028117 RepID=UPI001689FC3C|nr:hypothetical protein [Nodosilinea sp. FACHB-13]MBD2107410.1 hypothetical protein [Nodosilinea sp. FACHB-13]